MKDVMVDIETFGNSKHACIVQIGACYFDRETGAIGDCFSKNIDARSSVACGAQIDADTVYWWLQQDRAAVGAIMTPPFETFGDAIMDINDFLVAADCIWSHATFDFVILMGALKMVHVKPKFSYRAARDIRTLTDLAKLDYRNTPRAGIHHNALDDAKYQVSYCVEAFKKLKVI